MVQTQGITSSMRAHAEQLVFESYTWARGRSKTSGEGFYVVPASKAGTAHYSSRFGCTCKSYRWRGECSHHLACVMLQAESDARIMDKVRAADAERRAKLYDVLSPVESV